MRGNPSPGALACGSYYELREGDNPLYGTWPGQIIMGESCSIHATGLADGSTIAVDALGVPGAFRKGGVAIHISGIGNDGKQTGPGFIRALSLYHVIWADPTRRHCSGLGRHESQPAVIVEDDSNRYTQYWRHFAHYGHCDGYWTLDGVYHTFRDVGNFTAADVVEVANRQGRKLDDQHVRSARRLLEAAVDASNHRILDAPALRRFGRWAYTWRRDQVRDITKGME